MYISAFCIWVCLNAMFRNLLMSLLLLVGSSIKLLYISSAKLKYVHATSVESSVPLAFDKSILGLLILQSYGMAHNRFSWWNIPVFMILLILAVKSVSFMRGWERIWMFVITLLSTIPFNVKMGVNIVDWYFVDSFLVTKIIFRVIVYMSLLSAEEIMMCFVSNIIWSEQKDTFLNEVREEEDGSI